MSNRLIDLKGLKFGRLTVIERYDSKRWLCKCDCGNITHSDGYQLRKGEAQSCGCYHRDLCGDQHRTHGLTKTRLYRIWYHMKERCYVPSCREYRWYGKAGITICKEWLSNFQNLYDWSMEHGYKENLTIDRIDPRKNYEPDNCRWIPPCEQANNTRRTIRLLVGEQEYTISELSKRTGVKHGTIDARIRQNRSALTDKEMISCFGEIKEIIVREREA